jgi:hypothetical protein
MYHNDALLLSGLDTASAIDTTYVVSDDVAKIDSTPLLSINIAQSLCPGIGIRESCLPVSIPAPENFYEGNAEKYETGIM